MPKGSRTPSAANHAMGASMTRFLKFGGVGVINTAVDFAVFAALLSLTAPVAAAHIGAFLIANICSYCLNARFTFGDRAPAGSAFLVIRRYGAFLLGHSATLAATTFLVVLLAAPLGPLLAKLLVIPVGMAVNYLVAARIVFVSGGPAADF